MLKEKYKYQINLFLSFAIIWELIFWLLAWQLLSILGIFSTDFSAERLTFLHPSYGWWNFVIIPLVFGVFLYQIIQRNRLIDQLGGAKVVQTLLRPISTIRVFFRYLFIRNILVFALFALMQPALGSKMIKGTTSGIDIIFAVDISNSMNTRDIQGGESRLTVAKRVMNQFINQSKASRVGLLIFAGNAVPQLPLTADIDAAKMYINELRTDLISNQGTNIAAALKEVNRFFTKEETKKVLVLITDGEDHEGGLKNEYKQIKERGINSYILGIGTQKGGIVPQKDQANANPMRDKNGNVVVSKVNASMVREIADGLNGKSLITGEAFPNLSEFLTQINSSSETNIVDLEFKVKENRFQWPLGIALGLFFALLIWESIPRRKTRYV